MEATDDQLREFFAVIARRYGLNGTQALQRVLAPVLIPITAIDKAIFKVPGQSHYRASFEITLDEGFDEFVRTGRTGKFVPSEYVAGSAPWREIAKGRIVEVDTAAGVARGEIYSGGSRSELSAALDVMKETDYLEVDQYGASAKVLSALVEATLATNARQAGYRVTRLPEDMARHLGVYANYDFEFEKDGVTKRIEVKSIWGTNTRFARLIHSKTSGYPTSSCKFETQDIFAVSLFLRTGDIGSFAFARSVPRDVAPYGLPRSTGYPEHVHQNPACTVGDGSWFGTIDEVWELP